MTLPFVNDEAAYNEAISNSTPTLVDFTADWCGYCHRMLPMLEQLAADESDRLTIIKVDVDIYPDVMERYGIQGLPTLILFEEGEELGRFVGAQNKASLLAQLEPLL